MLSRDLHCWINCRIKLSIYCNLKSKFYSTSTFQFKSKDIVGLNKPHSIQPTTPSRTRFAPSPTGFLHLGSLRTALYNYLLARATGGQFILRLEDTDQNRLVAGAEQNIYDSLRWAGINWDEGPNIGGPHGPYRQSERSNIYSKYAQTLINLSSKSLVSLAYTKDGYAYRCFCPKHRLDNLRNSAKRLHPPSLASYDRKCSHLSDTESLHKADSGESYVIRFKSPLLYPEFEDLLHGKINLQVQINHQDLRYEDPVLVKSDGLPTYHLANVVDDHLMGITHVIRGVEWLASTPKHVAIYSALKWQPPLFVHIPLLTALNEKKLSKRSGDIDIMSMASNGYLPEALVNFVALFGWSPPHKLGVAVSEIFGLKDLETKFSLDGLTKGNTKVDDSKLNYFNKHYFAVRLDDPIQQAEIFEKYHAALQPKLQKISDIPDERYTIEYSKHVFDLVKHSGSSVEDLVLRTDYLFNSPSWDGQPALKFLKKKDNDLNTKVLELAIKELLAVKEDWNLHSLVRTCDNIKSSMDLSSKQMFEPLRFALAGSVSGVNIPTILLILGPQISQERIKQSLDLISR